MRHLKIYMANLGFRWALFPLMTPPLGIMYLASYLREKFDADIKLINQRAENTSNDELVRRIAAHEADVVILSAITPTAKGLPYITKEVRKALPNALILIGGPHVSAYREKVLENTEANAAVSGEGELAVEAIIGEHFDGGGLEKVPGLLRRSGDGEIITNPGSFPLIQDVDSLPIPAYDLIDLPAYWKTQGIAPIPRRNYASLFTSRGCPYRCFYCHDVFGKRFRQHSAERVVDEILRLQKAYGGQGLNEIEFLDDIFNLNPRRLLKFCDLVHKKNIKVKLAFPTGVRTDIYSHEGIDAIVEAGAYYSSFSLESGVPRIQKLMKKNLNIEKFVDNVNYFVKKGVFANGYAMLGFPTETEAEIKQTIDVMCNTLMHTVSFHTVTPFPGTELYQIVKQTRPDLLSSLNYDSMDFSGIRCNLSDVPDEKFFKFQRMANRKFFMNPNRIMRIIRDFPQPHYLPLFIPQFVKRMTKGLLPAYVK